MRLRWVSLLLFAAACSAAKDCTTIGCTTGVLVRGPAGIDGISEGTLTVCVDGDCTETAFDPGQGVDLKNVPFPEMRAGDTVRATLVMPDGSHYEDEVQAVRSQPNGPGCSPVCVDAELTLTSA